MDIIISEGKVTEECGISFLGQGLSHFLFVQCLEQWGLFKFGLWSYLNINVKLIKKTLIPFHISLQQEDAQKQTAPKAKTVDDIFSPKAVCKVPFLYFPFLSKNECERTETSLWAIRCPQSVHTIHINMDGNLSWTRGYVWA